MACGTQRVFFHFWGTDQAAGPRAQLFLQQPVRAAQDRVPQRAVAQAAPFRQRACLAAVFLGGRVRALAQLARGVHEVAEVVVADEAAVVRVEAADELVDLLVAQLPVHHHVDEPVLELLRGDLAVLVAALVELFERLHEVVRGHGFPVAPVALPRGLARVFFEVVAQHLHHALHGGVRPAHAVVRRRVRGLLDEHEELVEVHLTEKTKERCE